MNGPVIEINGLVKRYDGKPAVLEGVSFSVEEGEFVTVYGKSGCGKTTLLNIVGGLDRPDSGSVMISGEDIVGLSEDGLARLRLEKIGFVFQDFNLLLDLSVRDNIALPLRLLGRHDLEKVDLMLDRFDIGGIADERANAISGGEAQRAAIARAMMNGPKIILADEPTGNLDSENTEKVVEAFRTARADFGTAVVLATHDKDLARHASTIVSLRDGKASVEKRDE